MKKSTTPKGKTAELAGVASRLSIKRRGEVAEAAFLIKAATLGFSVAKPWGDSDPYDFIVQSGANSVMEVWYPLRYFA